MMRIARWWCLLLAAVPIAASCARVDSIKWTEDVLLPDGRTVTLSRYEEFGGRYAPGQQSPTTSASGFEFKHPTTGRVVRFRGNHYFSTRAIFVNGTDTFLILHPYLGGSASYEGCPSPPYVFAKHSVAGWHRIAYAESPLRRITQNMLGGVGGKTDRIRERQNRLGVEFLITVGRPARGLEVIDVDGVDHPKLSCPERRKPLPIEAEGGAK